MTNRLVPPTMRTVLALGAILFLILPCVVGQDRKRQLQEKPPPIYTQLEQPIPERYLKLFKPDFAKLSLVGTSSRDGENHRPGNVERFNSGNGISFLLTITNASEEEVVLYSQLDLRILNRPQLYRDGELVSYRDKVRSLLAIDPAPNGRTNVYILQPVKSVTETITLDEWYAPLQPGRYEISVWHRCIWGGEWLESPSVVFEVAKPAIAITQRRSK